jgi:hypothetical protein
MAERAGGAGRRSGLAESDWRSHHSADSTQDACLFVDEISVGLKLALSEWRSRLAEQVGGAGWRTRLADQVGGPGWRTRLAESGWRSRIGGVGLAESDWRSRIGGVITLPTTPRTHAWSSMRFLSDSSWRSLNGGARWRSTLAEHVGGAGWRSRLAERVGGAGWRSRISGVGLAESD